MRVYILGIAGTFMGSLAQLAQALGHEVSGVDNGVYPPMSDQLQAAGISYDDAYEKHSLSTNEFDWVIVGNAISRGNPALEYVLDNNMAYTSAPQWIAEHVLQNRHVLAVSGTHGKTTTSSMLAWVLDYAGLEPGYLIGGVPENFGQSARLGKGDCFVIEADEYDSAFCDKRSKFVHYRPKTLIINNIEFDHADIFSSMSDIQTQFHHLVRTVPSQGQIIFYPEDAIDEVLEKGCWSKTIRLSGEQSSWGVRYLSDDLSRFEISHQPENGDPQVAQVNWSLSGEHNIQNALAAVVAATQVGVSLETACVALESFENVKRRMQLIGDVAGVKVFDDFAHHPTAIQLTLEGARKKFPTQRLVAIVEARSNTMKLGVHNQSLPIALECADKIWWCGERETAPTFDPAKAELCPTVDEIVEGLKTTLNRGDVVIVMSNGAFGGIHQRLIKSLEQAAA